ncbi:SGNH hydrolase-type esterase domain-containing protein [Boeremia exigua]|uniref:SGNH hydrolase-type esterase domain-containing protein n=1 Tax=Boeremia exigua TaxID=749465 RepID=UPI001E8E1B44|nr:SGNH hydrolase-type esterase domain-containing protein [Boeremia exigua]KAH6614103.1 SGNH hydrolase-type esterase domain-containing protein [Boeremia exigua]
MVRLGALAFGLLTVVAQVSAQKTVKIMPFGASIVSRCWRANLQTKLRNEGFTNFDFVGTQKSSCAGANIDQDHEGHPGSQATDYAAKGNLTVWLNAVDTPDVILMLLGTNDVLLGKKPVGDILKAYDVLIEQMRAKNPKMHILFSNLLPLDPARWPATGAQGIEQLNTAIRQYVPSKNTRDSPVVFVDNFTGFDAVADTTDGEHPNDSGNEKMGSVFYAPTRDAIKAVSATKPTVKRASGFLNRRLALLTM